MDQGVPAPAPPSSPASGPAPGQVSAGWLATSSMFGMSDEHRIKRAFGASVASGIAHALLFGVLLYMAAKATGVINQPPPEPLKFVYLQTPGPGGGGGGSPQPAPKRQMEVPKSKAPDPIPITPPPPQVTPPPPIPQMTAPIVTSTELAQASGTSSVSLSAMGGGGSGGGLGSGRGDGVGPGVGGGFGDGFYRPGAGITYPEVIREIKPSYTPEAMRLKLQGIVKLQIEILANGSVGNVRVIKSLDKTHGLDEEAIKAAKNWIFRPARDREGKSVPVLAELELSFNLH